MAIYKNKISKFKKFVYDIPVFQSGNQVGYHIIIVTNSKGAGNIVDSAINITKVKAEMIGGGIKGITNKTHEISDFFKMFHNQLCYNFA